jgi:hypothetical protein
MINLIPYRSSRIPYVAEEGIKATYVGADARQSGTFQGEEFSQQKNVIILCDSWYMKQNLVSIIEEYENLDLIGNARSDSVIYDLAPAPTGHRGSQQNTEGVFQ